MAAIRIEADGTSNWTRVYLWLSRHRQQQIELDQSRRIALGTPISGARAVIIGVALQDDERPGSEVGGVVRAISNRADDAPVKLVFEGRSAGNVSPDQAKALAAQILDVITEQISADGLYEDVA